MRIERERIQRAFIAFILELYRTVLAIVMFWRALLESQAIQCVTKNNIRITLAPNQIVLNPGNHRCLRVKGVVIGRI